MRVGTMRSSFGIGRRRLVALSLLLGLAAAAPAQAGSIAGTVKDSGGNPLEGVHVCACDLDWYWAGCGDSDALGVYAIDGLPAGSYKVEFDGQLSGFVPEWYLDKPDFAAADAVAVAAGLPTSGIDACLAPGGAITGTVTGSLTGPLEGVYVCAYEPDWDWAGCDWTDSSGVYTLRGLRTGGYKVEFYGGWSDHVDEWYSDKPDFDTADEVAVTAELTVSGIDASLALTGSITGTVRDGGGNQLAGVSACAYDRNREQSGCGSTDAFGYYAIVGLPAGSYRVEFDGQQAGYIIEWSLNKADYYAADTVVVTAGNPTLNVNASLARGGSISGTVTAGWSAARADVEVYEYSKTRKYWIRRGWSETDVNGDYTVRGLPAGSFYVSFSPWDGDYLYEYYNGAFVPEAAAPVNVRVGMNTPRIDVDLQAPGRIEGTVAAGDGGDLGGVAVEIYSSAGLVETAAAVAGDTGASYSYSVTGLQPGDYWVKFRPVSPAYAGEWYPNQRALALAGAVPVAGGGVASGIDASLESGGSIAGTVTAAGGEVLGGEVRVRAYDDFGEVVGEGCAAGWNSYSYAIGSLRPGDYRLRFEPGPDSRFVAEYHANQQDLPAAAAVTVAAAAITTVDAELEAGYGISGAVSAGDGGVLGPVQVDVYDLARSLVATTQADVDRAYTYRTPALKPGGYFVQFTPKTPRMADPAGLYAAEFYNDQSSFAGAALVTVGTGGDTAGIDAVLEVGGAIAGAVSSFDGESLGPVVAVEIYAGAGNRVGTAFAGALTGYTYRTDGLRPGSYFVKYVPAPAYASRFYVNTPVIGSAKPVTVSKGVVTKVASAALCGDPPTGTVTINGSAVTRSTAATLTLTATGGATQMCISNTANCSAWTAFAGGKNWTLPAGNGLQTVSVWFRDQCGSTSATPSSDTVLLDTTKPTNGQVTVAQSHTHELTLNWSGFDDAAGSGISSYKVVFLAGVTAPATCSAGKLIHEGVSTITTFTHSGLNNGTTYAYRVCAIDAAGNMSTGATKSGKAVPETNPPTGAVTIKGGDAATRSALVQLTLTLNPGDAEDGAIQMCISNMASCSAWTAFAATKNWTLPSGNGIKIVKVWFRDQWGNTSATPASDTILLDTVAPANVTLLVTAGPGENVLDWTDSSDNVGGSGVGGYRLVFAIGIPPASCAAGTVIYEGPGTITEYTHTGLSNRNYAYRVCAVDNAGNRSSGATGKATPSESEPDPPWWGSVEINKGAAWTKSSAVTLSLDVLDDSPPIQMCVSNTTDCTAWMAFAQTKPWTLAAGNGTRTVSVLFRDTWGHVTPAPYNATIGLDAIAPGNVALTVTGGPEQNALSWTPASDGTGSGVVGYRVVFKTGTTAPPCSTGTPVSGYDGFSESYLHEGLVAGTTYAYRVCAIDAAGNMSSGAAKLGKALAP